MEIFEQYHILAILTAFSFVAVGSDVKGESEIKGNTALIIGSAGASGALLVIAIIVGVVILKFRKRKRYFDQLL